MSIVDVQVWSYGQIVFDKNTQNVGVIRNQQIVPIFKRPKKCK